MNWLRKLIAAFRGGGTLVKPPMCFICGAPTEWTYKPYFRCTGKIAHVFNADIDYSKPLEPKPPKPEGEI